MARFLGNRLLEYTTCLCVATLAAGCGGASSDEQVSSNGNAPADAPTTGADHKAPADDAIDLRGVDYGGLLQFIDSHRGHAIVLDIWNTSCGPCVRELPNLAKLHEDYREEGVVCASLNIDFTGAEGTTPDEAKERAQEVLEALDVRVHNLYSTVSDDELYRTELFKKSQVYAVPAILVIDRAGEVMGNFGDAAENASPYEEVRRAIDTLL